MLANLSDARLMELIRKDHMEAFDELYHRYVVMLLNTAYQRLGSEEDAKDVVQDVFYSLLLRKNQLEDGTHIRHYLFISLKHKILDLYRKERVRMSEHHLFAVQNWIQEIQAGESIDQQVEAMDLEERIHHFIEGLPKKCREAFVMSRVEHLSYKEIANKMEVSIKTVEKHISKALRIIQARLDGDR